MVSQQVFQRSYIAPPGTPAEQVGILRTAFDATMKDPQFLADAEKMHIDISPLPGAKVQELVRKLYATPKDDRRARPQGDQAVDGADAAAVRAQLVRKQGPSMHKKSSVSFPRARTVGASLI